MPTRKGTEYTRELASHEDIEDQSAASPVKSFQLIIELLIKDLKDSQEEVKDLRRENILLEEKLERDRNERSNRWLEVSGTRGAKRYSNVSSNGAKECDNVQLANRFSALEVPVDENIQQIEDDNILPINSHSRQFKSKRKAKLKTGKVILFSDSHGRGCASQVQDSLCNMVITTNVKPGA